MDYDKNKMSFKKIKGQIHMKNRMKIIAAIATIGACLCAFAAEDEIPEGPAHEEIVQVVATGVGKSVAEAKKEACRNAIQQVVGQMLDAETLVKNDQLVTDDILTYSAGYIKNFKLIGEPKKLGEGLVKVKILAKVKKDQVTEKIRATDSTILPISGEALYRTLTSRDEQLAEAKKMLEKCFEGVPCKLLKATVVSQANEGLPFRRDPKTRDVLFDVYVTVDPDKYNKWAKDLVVKMNAISDCKSEFDYRGKLRLDSDSDIITALKKEKENMGAEDILAVAIPPSKSLYNLERDSNSYCFVTKGVHVYCYALNGEKGETVRQVVRKDTPHVKVVLKLHGDDDVIASGAEVLWLDYAERYHPGLFTAYVKWNDVVYPAVVGGVGFRKIVPGIRSTINLGPLSNEELRNLKNISCTVEPYVIPSSR